MISHLIIGFDGSSILIETGHQEAAPHSNVRLITQTRGEATIGDISLPPMQLAQLIALLQVHQADIEKWSRRPR